MSAAVAVTAAKYGKLQQMLFDAPEYFGLADRNRAACMRFMVVAGAEAPETNELEAVYIAAVYEARTLVAEGLLTGIDPSDLELAQAAPLPTGIKSDDVSAIVVEPRYIEATDPISLTLKANGMKFGPCPGCGLHETLIFEDEDADGEPRKPAKPALCGDCDNLKFQKSELRRAKKARVAPQAKAAAPEATPSTSPSLTADELPEYEFHAVAEIFPMMPDTEIKNLAEDIKTNGLRDDIITVKGKIADGRNRYRACKLAGVLPTFKEWGGEGSLVAFVLSLNLHRRHLTDSQRAMVAASATAAFEAEAEVRRVANLAKNKGPAESADLRSREPNGTENGKSAAKAAEHLKVSTRAVEQASRVIREGDDSLVEAVNQGTVSLDAAATVSKLPRAEQKKLVQNGKVKATAAQMRKAKAIEKKPMAQPKPTPAPEPVVMDSAPQEPPLALTEPASVEATQTQPVGIEPSGQLASESEGPAAEVPRSTEASKPTPGESSCPAVEQPQSAPVTYIDDETNVELLLGRRVVAGRRLQSLYANIPPNILAKMLAEHDAHALGVRGGREINAADLDQQVEFVGRIRHAIAYVTNPGPGDHPKLGKVSAVLGHAKRLTQMDVNEAEELVREVAAKIGDPNPFGPTRSVMEELMEAAELGTGRDSPATGAS